MKETKVQKSNRGITLIALVVTIIVLLILAGVSIQMLTGQTGILKNAQQARKETVEGQIKEDVQRDIMEKMIEKQGDITADELYEILNKYFEGVPAPGEGEGNPWNAKDFPESFPELQSKEGNYPFTLGDLYRGDLSGTQTGNTPPTTGGTPGNPKPDTGIFTKNSTIDGTTGSYKNPTIPAGFKPVNDGSNWGEGKSAPEEREVNKGLVIEDEEHNQFVWVPVPNAKEEEIVTNNTEEIQLRGYNSKTTPMAEKDEEGHYRGVLYDETSYNLTGETKTVKYIQYNASSYREPDVVTSYDGTDSDPIKLTKETLQDDYDTMVGSMYKYGGFYVARYEMSLSADKKAQYKKGETSTNASVIENKWYGFYEKQKEFATKYKEVNSTIKSSMIWGSQYDAMMNWMARCGINIGGGSSNLTGKAYNSTQITGKEGDADVLNNIYDLIGCRYEWTLEANSTGSRTYRGGSFYSDGSPSRRNFINPTDTDSSYGSRASLYL